jgi:hypothetical protein
MKWIAKTGVTWKRATQDRTTRSGRSPLDEAWWPRWNDEGDRRELTALAGRSAEHVSDDPERCVLPPGHAGAHSFEYDRTD